MAAKKPGKLTSDPQRQVSSLGAQSPFGGEVEQIGVPSGQRLIFGADEAAILVYIGEKDISDQVPDEKGNPQPKGSVIYQTFNDGRRFVTMPNSWQISKAKFEPMTFYYLHVTDEVRTRKDFNPMKDFEIFKLGTEGRTIACKKEIFGVESLTLSLQQIAELNYSALNYPLRKPKID